VLFGLPSGREGGGVVVVLGMALKKIVDGWPLTLRTRGPGSGGRRRAAGKREPTNRYSIQGEPRKKVGSN